MKIGYCLVSQQLRDKIKRSEIIPNISNILQENNRSFVNKTLEEQIQPSSYEPRIGDHLFILDTDVGGIFRPEINETVRRHLLKLPKRQRQEIKIDGGFELKRGFSYLVPLEDRIKLKKDEHVISSPKSSRGRLFINTRLLTDYNPCLNEIEGEYKADVYLDLWLLIQPTKFNIIIHPKTTLNQLRFFVKETDPRLTDDEIREEIKKKSLFYIKSGTEELIPTNHIIREGLQIHLDLIGQFTEGIVGLKARNNPNPIDITRKQTYEAENYFEPIVLKKGIITVERGDYCLFASQEILETPNNLSAELKKHSHIGINGSLHDAGFIDNGFKGNIVFEVRTEESTKMELRHGMPVSKLKLFRTLEEPDKIYSIKIGSSYQNQFGPHPSNNFVPFDYKYATKNYKKLDRLVLTQDKEILLKHRKTKEGFEFIEERDIMELTKDVISGFFHSRYDCESDETVLQPIPYVLLFGNEKIFSYIRAENIKDYGDERLFGKHSIGVGGHIITSDSPDFLENCIGREVMKEEIEINGEYFNPKIIGTLMAYEKLVDRVHFGLIYTIHTAGEIKPKESSLISGRMIDLNELNNNKQCQKYETWSRMLVPYLKKIYTLTKPKNT